MIWPGRVCLWIPATVDLVKEPAPEALLDRFAAVLGDLGTWHGLSNLRHGGPGTIVADVEHGRTLTDLARFELEAESLIGHEVFVISSDAPAGSSLVGDPLRVPTAA
jgi:hypothetical protein